MKVINIILLALSSLCFACSEQEVDLVYNEKNGIYFLGKMDNNSFQPHDSLLYSLGLRPDSIRFDTIYVGVTYLGQRTDIDRKVGIEVLSDYSIGNIKTTMEEGKHYQKLRDFYLMPAGEYVCQIPIIFDRHQFNTSFQKAEEHYIVLGLKPTDDFEIGIEEAKELVLRVNNYMAMPLWWDLDGVPSMEKKLGFYHPEKWKALIFVDDRFGDPYELGISKNDGALIHTKVEAAKNLDPWWPKIDSETGDSIYFDRIVSPTLLLIKPIN